ncbi:type II toxin-antitoxin system Phd/YefM family antitoxin [Candidatus Peregrinibacteria bacterium]|nr:type II toxin-antitoxin system Phd/YefM family antitoxin [Candidatus Peregrinibacteria bacterium]
MTKTVTASEARNNFFAILQEVKTPGVSVMITHEGHPAGVLMSAEEFEGLMETLDIMSDPEEAAEILDALRHKDTEETVTLDELKKDLGLA